MRQVVVDHYLLQQRLAQDLALCIPTHIIKQQYNASYDPVLRFVGVNASNRSSEKTVHLSCSQEATSSTGRWQLCRGDCGQMRLTELCIMVLGNFQWWEHPFST